MMAPLFFFFMIGNTQGSREVDGWKEGRQEERQIVKKSEAVVVQKSSRL